MVSGEVDVPLAVIRGSVCRCSNSAGRHGCDLIAQAALDALQGAGWRVVRNGEHLLHQRDDGWMLEHTLDCRERGLVHCDIGVVASEGAWETVETGTYLVIDVPGESLRLERRS